MREGRNVEHGYSRRGLQLPGRQPACRGGVFETSCKPSLIFIRLRHIRGRRSNSAE